MRKKAKEQKKIIRNKKKEARLKALGGAA